MLSRWDHWGQEADEDGSFEKCQLASCASRNASLFESGPCVVEAEVPYFDRILILQITLYYLQYFSSKDSVRIRMARPSPGQIRDTNQTIALVCVPQFQLSGLDRCLRHARHQC